MYMLVFVTLVVSMLGIYTQVFTQQTLRLYAQQAGIGQTLLAWHSTGAALAYNIVASSSIGATGGCLLTNTTGFGYAVLPIASCIDNIVLTPVAIGGTPPAGTSACGSNIIAPCWTYLPQGYNATPYTFYTVAYQASVAPVIDYVLTFVPPSPSLGNDYAGRGGTCLPGVMGGVAACPTTQYQISLALTDIYRQLQRTRYSNVSYGTVNSSNQLVTQPIIKSITDTSPFLYPVPTYVPAGSIGVITQFLPCSSC